MSKEARINAKAELVRWHLDYECTESEAEWLDYRYTLRQLKNILSDIDRTDWNGKKEASFLGNLRKH